jgi:hypothetical protein
MDEVWDEYWKPLSLKGLAIDGYCISNYGRVCKYSAGSFRILKKHKHVYSQRGNHENVSILGKSQRVHRLVAEAFLPLDSNPPIPQWDWDATPPSAKSLIAELLLVDHIDGDPFNNHVSNLRWVTHLQNNFAYKKQKLIANGSIC